MKCPIDGADLVMSERQGIEIDYCPKCRGVWLDRGELDKIIERSLTALDQPSPGRSHAEPDNQYDQPSYRRPSDRDHAEDRHHDDRDHGHHGRQDQRAHDPRRARRRSLLGDLFDFGD